MSREVRIRKGKTEFIAETAEGFFEQFLGLMFSKKKNILFIIGPERTFGIHSFFVFFEFDAIYLDSKRRVVDVIKAIPPWKPYLKNNAPAVYLLELCEENNVKIGDVLEW